MRFSSWPFHATRTAWALIVIPRSRSSSIESSSCSRISRAETVSVTSRMRSASVDLPWSMCAMIEKLRILLWSMAEQGYSAPGRAPARRPRAGASRSSDLPARCRADALLLDDDPHQAVRPALLLDVPDVAEPGLLEGAPRPW